MSVPPVAEEADSVVAVAANEVILLTIAASRCTHATRSRYHVATWRPIHRAPRNRGGRR